jgi:hypothetical protein
MNYEIHIYTRHNIGETHVTWLEGGINARIHANHNCQHELTLETYIEDSLRGARCIIHRYILGVLQVKQKGVKKLQTATTK